MRPHRPPRPQDLLPARRPHVTGAAARRLVAGGRVLVTGAAGSVGGALVRRLSALDPAAVHLLDVDEGRLHALELELTGRGVTGTSAVLLADVRDARALDAAFDEARPDLVLHAAALGHATLVERFSCAAVMTNVWGTQNVVRAAARHGVQRLVHVSGDQAADPTSVLGATQRLAEQVVRGADVPRTASVRFGTALGSRGSFWDTLVHQTAAGLPVTVTDPEATGHAMTLDEAAALVVEVAALAPGGGTYALDTGDPVRVLDLVHRYAELAGLPAPRVTVTGPGPGDAPRATSPGTGERRRPTGVDRVLRCPPAPRPPGFERVLAGLYAAADDADAPRVRRLLAEQFPGLRAAGDDVGSPGDHAPARAPALRVLGPVPA